MRDAGHVNLQGTFGRVGALFTYVYYHGMKIVFNLGILGDEKTYKYPLYWAYIGISHRGPEIYLVPNVYEDKGCSLHRFETHKISLWLKCIDLKIIYSKFMNGIHIILYIYISTL